MTKVQATRDIFVEDLFDVTKKDYASLYIDGGIKFNHKTGLMIKKGTKGRLMKELANGIAANIVFEGHSVWTFLADTYEQIA